MNVTHLIEYILLILINLVPLIICIAFYTIAERKVLASLQRRVGPNVVGLWGLLQPFADGIKLIFKEIIFPAKANILLFLVAPVITLTLALFSWALIPFSVTSIFIESTYNLLILFAISSLSVYGIILAGWSSNSKYSFLGSLRSTAQMISYEVSLMLSILPIIICSGSFNLIDVVLTQKSVWYFLPFLPLALIFIISAVAETNRTPFDLPEAEAELVAGFNVEYSSITFALFFLGEYSNMILMASLITLLFFGGWLTPWGTSSVVWFVLKIIFFCFLFILIRGTVPRYRYDQLMEIGWKLFLPFTTAYLLFIASIVLITGAASEMITVYTFTELFYQLVALK